MTNRPKNHSFVLTTSQRSTSHHYIHSTLIQMFGWGNNDQRMVIEGCKIPIKMVKNSIVRAFKYKIYKVRNFNHQGLQTWNWSMLCNQKDGGWDKKYDRAILRFNWGRSMSGIGPRSGVGTRPSPSQDRPSPKKRMPKPRPAKIVPILSLDF